MSEIEKDIPPSGAIEINPLLESKDWIKYSANQINSIGAMIDQSIEKDIPVSWDYCIRLIEKSDDYIPIQNTLDSIISQYNTLGVSLEEDEKNAIYNASVQMKKEYSEERKEELLQLSSLGQKNKLEVIPRLINYKEILNYKIPKLKELHPNSKNTPDLEVANPILLALIQDTEDLENANFKLAEIELLKKRAEEKGKTNSFMHEELEAVRTCLKDEYHESYEQLMRYLYNKGVRVTKKDLRDWEYECFIAKDLPFDSSKIVPFSHINPNPIRREKEDPLHFKEAKRFVDSIKTYVRDLHIAQMEEIYKGKFQVMYVTGEALIDSFGSDGDYGEIHPDLTRKILKSLRPEYSDEQIEKERERIFGSSPFLNGSEKTDVLLRFRILYPKGVQSKDLIMERFKEKIFPSIEHLVHSHGGLLKKDNENWAEDFEDDLKALGFDYLEYYVDARFVSLDQFVDKNEKNEPGYSKGGK